MNIILIGMAAVGKSTIGRLLATQLGWAFVDTDQLLEAWWGAPLQRIRDHLGREAFIQAESAQILRLHVKTCVLATGGSVIYSNPAMQHLQQLGQVVYLSASFPTIAKRLQNPEARGLVQEPGQSLKDLYDERAPLYADYAHVTVNTDTTSPEQICQSIVQTILPITT